MSRGFRRSLAVWGALGVLAVTAYLVMSTPWFRRALEGRVVRAAEDLTGARIAVREFRFNPAIFQITLRGVVLRGAEPATASPLFSAQTVILGLSPSALLRLRVHVRSLEWDSAEIHLRTAPDGTTNLPGPKLSAHGEQALHELLNLSIGRLTALHTNLFWNNRKVPLEFSARDVAFQLRQRLLGGYAGSFSSSQTALAAPQWNLPPSTIAAQFHFTHRELTVDSLQFRAQDLNGKCSVRLGALPALHAGLNFSATGDFPALARALRFQPNGIPQGGVSVEGAADYAKGNWTSEGRVQVLQLAIPSRSFHPGRVDVLANYSFDRQRLAVSNLKISALGGTAQGAGEILFSGPLPAFEFHTELRNVEMAAALRAFPGAHTLSSHLPPASSIEGKLSAAWQGRFRGFKSGFDLRFTPRRQALPPWLPVEGFARGAARFSQGIAIDLDAVRFQTPHSYMTAQGTAGYSASNLSVRVGASDFEELRPLAQFLLQAAQPVPVELRSQATFSGQVHGPIAGADIEGQLRAGPFQYDGSNWDGFTANVHTTRALAEISSARFVSRTSALEVNASAHLVDWQLDRTAPAHITLLAQRAPVEALQSAFSVSYPFTGSLTGGMTLDGPISNLAGTGNIQIDRGQIYQEPFDTLTARVRVAGPELTFDNAQLSRGAARVTGRAQFNRNSRSFSATLHGRDLAFADFERLLRTEKAGVRLEQISGAVNFDLSARVTPSPHRDVDLQSTWEAPSVGISGTPVADLSGRLDWHGQIMNVRIESRGPGGDFHLAGEAQTRGDWPIQLSGDYSNFRADPWIRLLAGGKFGARATAAGTLAVKGPLRDLDRLEIQSRARSLAIQLGDQSWSNAEPIALAYAQHTLSAKPFHMRGPSTNLEVEGSLRAGSSPALSLRAQGESEATLLGLLDPALHATGRSALSVTVSGSPSQPMVRGTVNVEGVSLGYGDFPFRLSGLSGNIELEGDRATAKSLRGQIGGGAATLSGFLTIAETPRFEISTALDQVRVQYPSDFTSLLTGDLNLTGTTEGGQLAGDLIVRQMFASESFNVLALIGEAATPLGAPASLTPSPLASKIRLNIRVTSDPEVRLETHDLRLVADIDTAIRGTLALPVEMGTVHILSGEAVVRGNRYRVNRGDITMANPFRTSPVLDLEARTRVQRYDVTTDITGPFDRMKIAYRSDPPLPSGDILSLLALGFVRETGQASIAATESARTVGASALLSQALASQTTGRIQRLFGVSRIRIDPNVGGPANVSGARVTVEQQVTRDLTLTYATNTGATQQQVVQFEWALSERLSLIGIRDQNGIFGVEFRLRRGFK